MQHATCKRQERGKKNSRRAISHPQEMRSCWLGLPLDFEISRFRAARRMLYSVSRFRCGIGYRYKERNRREKGNQKINFAYLDERLIPSGAALQFSKLSRVGHAKEKSPVVRRLCQPRSTHESSGRLKMGGITLRFRQCAMCFFTSSFLGQLITC